MANIEQLHDPLDPIAFFKYDWLFEKHWMKSQNSKLYTSHGKCYWFQANFSLTNACLTILSGLDLVLKKWEYFLNETLSKISRFWQTSVLGNNF